MAGYAATAPLNLAGPWGTAAWLVVGTGLTILTAVGLVELGKEITKTKEETKTKTATKTKTMTCQYYSVRIHAQGIDCGGTTASTIGAPAITQPAPVLVAQGLALSKLTQEMLTRTQRANRALEIPKAEAYIVSGPASGGRFGMKSFVNRLLRGGIRYDVDCLGCGPSFIA
jgi:hypothetical protein